MFLLRDTLGFKTRASYKPPSFCNKKCAVKNSTFVKGDVSNRRMGVFAFAILYFNADVILACFFVYYLVVFNYNHTAF